MSQRSAAKTHEALSPQESGFGLRSTRGSWLRVLRRYFGFMVISSLAWEALQLPLYTLWDTGSMSEIAFAVLHCSAGDLIIAAFSLAAALVLVGDDSWPARRHIAVALAVIVFGVVYTAYSEWLNVYVRGSWGYSPAMPLVPLIGVGLSPILQWIVLPFAAFSWAWRPSTDARGSLRNHTAGPMHPDRAA